MVGEFKKRILPGTESRIALSRLVSMVAYIAGIGITGLLLLSTFVASMSTGKKMEADGNSSGTSGIQLACESDEFVRTLTKVILHIVLTLSGQDLGRGIKELGIFHVCRH